MFRLPQDKGDSGVSVTPLYTPQLLRQLDQCLNSVVSFHPGTRCTPPAGTPPACWDSPSRWKHRPPSSGESLVTAGWYTGSHRKPFFWCDVNFSFTENTGLNKHVWNAARWEIVFIAAPLKSRGTEHRVELLSVVKMHRQVLNQMLHQTVEDDDPGELC